jgi:hypothetical protein
MSGYAHVRNGSFPDLAAPKREVRFALNQLTSSAWRGASDKGSRLMRRDKSRPYRSACRCGRARLIRSIPPSENPQSSASQFLMPGSGRSTPIL